MTVLLMASVKTKCAYCECRLQRQKCTVLNMNVTGIPVHMKQQTKCDHHKAILTVRTLSDDGECGTV